MNERLHKKRQHRPVFLGLLSTGRAKRLTPPRRAPTCEPGGDRAGRLAERALALCRDAQHHTIEGNGPSRCDRARLEKRKQLRLLAEASLRGSGLRIRGPFRLDLGIDY